MTSRARKLIALGLAIVGLLIAATYRPFGGGPTRITDPKQSGFDTGFNSTRLAPEDLARYGGPAGVARYLVTRHDIPKEMREVWCEHFVRGFEAGMRVRVEVVAK